MYFKSPTTQYFEFLYAWLLISFLFIFLVSFLHYSFLILLWVNIYSSPGGGSVGLASKQRLQWTLRWKLKLKLKCLMRNFPFFVRGQIENFIKIRYILCKFCRFGNFCLVKKLKRYTKVELIQYCSRILCMTNIFSKTIK